MPLSRNEAADALRDIAQTERRSSSAYGYKETAPFMFLWGVIWFCRLFGIRPPSGAVQLVMARSRRLGLCGEFRDRQPSPF